MKSGKTFKYMMAALTMLFLLTTCTACKSKETSSSVSADILNGDFEEVSSDNKWVGWTRKDAAFSVQGIVNSDSVNGVKIEKSGNYFFSGTNGGNQVMRGTLTSNVFKLGGNGYLTFKLGAGKNTEKCYVEFFEEGNNEAILRVANTDCDGIYITDHLITKVVDLSAYLGKNIYIVITDNDDGNDFSYLNFDAFHICTTQEEVTSAQNDYERQIKELGEKPFEEDETSLTIQNGSFETGDLTGWKILEGTALSRAGVLPTSQYYWTDRSVYGDGEYYLDGNNNGTFAESLTGSIRSSKFTLGGDGYISFMIGAAASNCYVAVCDANTEEELIVVGNDYFNDPALALTLLRVYVDASDYLGKVLYLKVVDANDASGFAFINVDDFRVSLTVDEVAALEVEQLEKIQKETYNSASYDDLATLLNYYNNYPYPIPLNSLSITKYAESKVVSCGIMDLNSFIADAKAVYGTTEITNFSIQQVTIDDQTFTDGFDTFDLSTPGAYHVTYGIEYEGKNAVATFTLVAVDNNYQVANGDFESGDLTGWKVLTDNWNMVHGSLAGVINAISYWDENLPYNQGGNYHLDGWNNGLPEEATWQVQSSNFTLSGSGFISLRMGGHAAAVKVFLSDGTQIGYYRQNRFNDANFPSLLNGGSWADMGTYVMDLSSYLGSEMYLVLCDEQAEGWAHAFFDEVVTYYEAAPDVTSLSDTVIDGGHTDTTVTIPWQLAQNQL